MLRWLVLGLLLCNLAYYFFGRQLEVGAEVAVSSSLAADGGRLLLLSERKGAGIGAANDKPVANTAVAAEPPVAVCHMIGPFSEKVSARQIRDRLQALDVSVVTYQLSIPEKPDYWVHLGPMRSRKEALDVLRELQSKNIDSFLIAEGELTNGISLGFFTKAELAEAIQRQRREQGYDAKTRQIPRFAQEFWQVLDAEQYNKMSDELWQKIKAGTQGLELRKNSCDLIASAERLD